MWNQDKYQKAIAFAGDAHKNQKVPGHEYNYVVHVSNVAMEIACLIGNESLKNPDLAIQCALLHDVIEDADESYISLLESKFGKDVLEGVQALTKNTIILKADRMLDSLNRIKKLGKEIACVKMADRITNLQSPPKHWTKEKINEYLNESILIYEQLGNYSNFLGSRLKNKIEEYKKYTL